MRATSARVIMGEPVGTIVTAMINLGHRRIQDLRIGNAMDVSDLKGLYAEVKKRMDGALDHLQHELAGVRTGRASVTILDGVQVEAYGSTMPLNQVAGLSVPEPTLIVAQPFDPSLLGAIEKAIPSVRASGSIPPMTARWCGFRCPRLTEERRKELSRLVHKLGRGGAQHRPPGPPRRQRPSQEAAEGSPDF